MVRRTRSAAAFTLVEMLVVIGITVLLMGILLPALSGARKRSAKTAELSDIRQVGYGWTMYANQNRDSCLPGWVDPDVQPAWKVKYKFPTNDTVPGQIAGPWVWRLLPYLDDNHELIHGYLDEVDPSIQSMVDEAEEVALTPAFGYNGFMIGGWWEMVDLGFGSGEQPRTRFWDAEYDGRPVNVISRSIGSIRRSTEVITFCSSGYGDPGRDFELAPGSCHLRRKPVDRDFTGSYYVTPPTMAQDPFWARGTAAIGGESYDVIQLFDSAAPAWQGTEFECAPAPLGRYTGQAAVLYADNHVDSPGIASLADQRKWIDTADDQFWIFSDPSP